MKRKTPENLEKQRVKQHLKLNGFFFYYNLAGIGVFPGTPDLTAIRNGKVLQIEVKAKKGGRQSQYQKSFQYKWEKAGGYYICGDFETIKKAIDHFDDLDFKIKLHTYQAGNEIPHKRGECQQCDDLRRQCIG